MEEIKKLKNGNKKCRVLVAVPVHSYMENACIKALFDLEKPKNVEIDFMYQEGYTVALARNLLTQYSLSKEYDYTLWVDADIVLPSDFLKRLLTVFKDKKDAGLACGYYLKKLLGKEPITELYGYTEDGKAVQNIKESVLPKEGGIYEIQGCGLGCALVKNSTMKQILDKYKICFEYRVNPGVLVSEDLDFCNKLKAEGLKLYADVSLKTPHIGKVAFS